MGKIIVMYQWLKSFFGSIPFIRNLYELSHGSLDLLYKEDDLNDEFYDLIKNLGDQELEHQIGRLRNFRKIIKEIKDQNLVGDFVEFGTWKGFSLLWIAYLSERYRILNKRMVSIDSFSGLPNSDGVFMKGTFADATLRSSRENIYRNRSIYEQTKKRVYVERFDFIQKREIIRKLKEIGCEKFVFIHIDCDIASSAIQVLEVLKEKLLADTCYLLFDDYGCESSLRTVVDKAFSEMAKDWQITEHSSSRFTKNFKLKRINSNG